MADIAITIPGEGAIIALARMVEALAEGQSTEQKKVLWDRYIELTAPFHAIAVELSKEAAAFVGYLMQIEARKGK